MKKIFSILLLLLTFTYAYSASIEPSIISVREDLFDSQKNLDSFSFRNKMSKEDEEKYKDIEVYLLTGGPGSLVWENFGHSAFIFSLPGKDEIMFDYGIFSFSEGFYKNFVLGRLYYSMMKSYASWREDSLISDDRSIHMLELELSELEKMNLAFFLEYNAMEENRTYLYDYYYDNCATRLRDSYNAVKGGAFKSWSENIEYEETLRELSIRYLSQSGFPVVWAINYLLGPEVDEKITLWDAMFLPEVLNSSIEEFQGNKAQSIYSSITRSGAPEKYSLIPGSILMAIVIAVFSLLTKSRKRASRRIGDIVLAIICLVLGVMSLALLFLMTASIHHVTYMNMNVLVISPVLVVLSGLHLVALGKKERRKALTAIARIHLLLALVLLILKAIFVQANICYFIVALTLYAFDSFPATKRK